MKITPATIGALLQRKTGKRALNFIEGPVVREREGLLLIRHCAIISSRCSDAERKAALESYKTILTDAGITTEDCTTRWGEPALSVVYDDLEVIDIPSILETD